MECSIVPGQRLSHSTRCGSEIIGEGIWRLDETGGAAANTSRGAGHTGEAVGSYVAGRPTTMSHRVLIVDDEAGIRQALKQVLEYEDLVVRVTASGGEAITVYSEFRPHLVFLDVKMAGLDGLETLSRLRDLDPKAQVVMISGHGTIATAVEATQRGAFDFLEKPLDTDRLLVTVRNALTQGELVGENTRLREATESRYVMVGGSSALQTVRELIEKVGPTAARVLITGENGTGKELVARALHQASRRRDRPFIEVNCAAIPSELIESELFGHMKGSFTGAFADRAGKFEQADGGTLFLDEVGDMSLSAQAKLLRVLQEGVVTRIGGSKPIRVDVRVLAATNKDLESEIGEGRFREDLLYRLNVVPIDVPPLRERTEDIPALVAHFTEQLAAGAGVPGRKFGDDAVRRLQTRSWPGNVRELRNAIERALILASGKVSSAADIDLLLPSPDSPSGEGSQTFEMFRQEAEKNFLEQKLREHDWNVSETARSLKMPRSNLYKKIERYGLTREPV
jgi:two-component system, NtrC family, nitrogen regulation response regulator NtrX